MILTDKAISHILNCIAELNRRIKMSNKPWPEWNQDIERRREAMNHELPPPTRPPTVFKDPTGGTYLYDGLTMDRQAVAYARVCIEPLQARIAELEVQEVQLAHLTASLETVSAAYIVLKQQREGWAKLASGQGPVAEIANTDSTGGYVNWLLHQGAPIKMGDKLFTHPAPTGISQHQGKEMSDNKITVQPEIIASSSARSPVLTDIELLQIAVEDQFLLYCDEDSFCEIARAIETAVLAKLADKLLDAERYAWLVKHAYVAKNFTTQANTLEIVSTNRAVPWSATWREGKYAVNDAIDAAMLVSKEKP
jgi:hypothetical protein